ncbi:MAG: hypothetical protein Q8M26_08590 [Pseudolabrys sp.]|nr:hypothetical protein [Pseudolabrys sp.]
MPKGITEYSKKIPGSRGNYRWPVRFEITDGYLAVTQYEGDKVKDKVLLSPAQVRKMVAFIER